MAARAALSHRQWLIALPTNPKLSAKGEGNFAERTKRIEDTLTLGEAGDAYALVFDFQAGDAG